MPVADYINGSVEPDKAEVIDDALEAHAAAKGFESPPKR
jgi:hypothetical protein